MASAQRSLAGSGHTGLTLRWKLAVGARSRARRTIARPRQVCGSPSGATGRKGRRARSLVSKRLDGPLAMPCETRSPRRHMDSGIARSKDRMRCLNFSRRPLPQTDSYRRWSLRTRYKLACGTERGQFLTAPHQNRSHPRQERIDVGQRGGGRARLPASRQFASPGAATTVIPSTPIDWSPNGALGEKSGLEMISSRE